ncbi:MAG: Mor transcription activator family protein [Methylobacter sp.]|uniref:Mor transcription activator family protein n=1 Tax=Candidatus Methylobacter titanis TaxID=3053457 RepID=A0AA43TLU8_9GAMM|nr:Mor transcription activator family protein [Candidatus Methylobacter titanis]
MTTHLFELPSALIPDRLQQISSYCGQQTALVLLLNFPGVHVRIPKQPNPAHKLAELLGMLAFSKLCASYGDEIITIPRAAKAIRALRNQQILAGFATGKTQAALAMEYSLTQRQVNKICNNVAIDRQLDLFSS